MVLVSNRHCEPSSRTPAGEVDHSIAYVLLAQYVSFKCVSVRDEPWRLLMEGLLDMSSLRFCSCGSSQSLRLVQEEGAGC